MENGCNGEVMSVGLTLCWIFSGGLLGGVFDFFNRFKVEVNEAKVCFQGVKVGFGQFLSLGIMNAGLGIGGALAVQFAMIGIGKFQQCKTVEGQILLLTISVVAGFSGRRFLSIVSSKLEDQIGEANRKIDNIKEEAEESIIISTATATLGTTSTASERSFAIQQIQAELDKKPDDRRFVILAGRLYRRNGDLISAIGVLNQFVNLKKKRNELDRDYADALYNRACYRVLMSEEAQDEEKVKELITLALDDLEISISINSENSTDAASDIDFNSVKQDERFQALTSE